MYARTSQHAAWRGIYFYLGDRDARIGKQFASIVLNPPHEHYGPTLTVEIPIGWRRATGGIYPRTLTPRIPLPWLRWHPEMGRVQLVLWRASDHFWRRMDGRRALR